MPNSTYIHIPFCKTKCKYCSFISVCNLEYLTGYVFSLLKEISENYNGEKQNTLYFGGGTPSLLPINLVKKIIDKFNFAKDCEITFELNPDDATEEYFNQLKSLGINRISLGSQTFDDNILKLIGRRHSSDDIKKTVYFAQKTGFENINVDLIYGLPQQNLESIRKDLEEIFNLGIQHISTYGLKIEEESFWGKYPPSELPNDDEQADMYIFINNELEKKQFKRYEISNFAKQGFESRHNLNYWNNEEYYGFGVAAHGYVNGIRYSNTPNLKNYLNAPAIHECGNFLTQNEKLEEEIFLGFRKEEGINTKKINEKYNIDFLKKYTKTLEKYKEFIIKTENGYKFNIEGVLISNIILADFLD